MMSLDTLCWAVKAQGQGQSLLKVAKCEHNLRSRGMEPLSIRKSAKKLMSFLISVSKIHQSSLTGPHKEIPDRGQFKSWNIEWKLHKKDHYITILLILLIMAKFKFTNTRHYSSWSEKDGHRYYCTKNCINKFGVSPFYFCSQFGPFNILDINLVEVGVPWLRLPCILITGAISVQLIILEYLSVSQVTVNANVILPVLRNIVLINYWLIEYLGNTDITTSMSMKNL